MADEQDVKYEEVQNLNPQPSHVIVSQLAKVGVEIRELGWKLLGQLSALFVIFTSTLTSAACIQRFKILWGLVGTLVTCVVGSIESFNHFISSNMFFET